MNQMNGASYVGVDDVANVSEYLIEEAFADGNLFRMWIGCTAPSFKRCFYWPS
jgi:hypothetical protein